MRRGGGDDNQSGEAAAAAASLRRSLPPCPAPCFPCEREWPRGNDLNKPSSVVHPFPVPPTPPGRGRESVRSPRGESRRGESRTAIRGAKGGRHLIGLLGRRQTQTGFHLRNTGIKVSESATYTTEVPSWTSIRMKWHSSNFAMFYRLSLCWCFWFWP